MTLLLKRREGVIPPSRLTTHPMLGRIERLAHRVEYRRMVDFEDREAIYHLRRNAYSRHRGGADAWAAPDIEDAHESNAETIGVFVDRRLVGSFKILVVTQEYPDCPSRDFFTEEVESLLAKGQMIIDPVRFVADKRATSEFPELPFLLLKIVIMACQYFPGDTCLSLIKKEHAPFYERIFYSEVAAGPRVYEPLQVDAVLMRSEIAVALPKVLERFPCWKADQFELRQVFGPLGDWPAVVQRMKQAA